MHRSCSTVIADRTRASKTESYCPALTQWPDRPTPWTLGQQQTIYLSVCLSDSSNRSNCLGGLNFISLNINSIRGKKSLDLLLSLTLDMAIQATKIDSWIASSELFAETYPYNIFKDRNLHGGGVMLLIHKDVPHMPLSELENDFKSVWVKIFANIMWQAGIVKWRLPTVSWSAPSYQIYSKHKGNKLHVP